MLGAIYLSSIKSHRFANDARVQNYRLSQYVKIHLKSCLRQIFKLRLHFEFNRQRMFGAICIE